MKKKLLVLTLSSILLANLAACQPKGKAEKQETSSTEQVKKIAETGTAELPSLSKEQILAIMPDVAKKAKLALIDNGSKIHPALNMKDKQILIVSNIAKTAYLVNSQDAKYGKPDEAVEYATDTITDEQVKTAGFGVTKFNDKETYFVNVDNQVDLSGRGDTEELINDTLKTVLHEAVHFFLQPNLTTGNDTPSLESINGKVTRAISYPIPVEARVARAQQAYFYREALKEKDEAKKIELIQKGNFFYESYLKANPANAKKAVYDLTEGQPTFLEARGLAVIANKNSDDSLIQQKTIENILADYRVQDEMLKMGVEDMEYYTVGSLAFANVQQLNHLAEVEETNQNPVEYLLKKYGVKEDKGNPDIKKGISAQFGEQNTALKTRIEETDKQVKDDNIVKIKVALPENIDGFEMHTDSVTYTYRDKPTTLETISQELKLGDNRMKLTKAELIKSTEGNQEYYYLLVPKEDVEKKGDKVSIQSNHVQVFDQRFKEEDGEIVLQ